MIQIRTEIRRHATRATHKQTHDKTKTNVVMQWLEVSFLCNVWLCVCVYTKSAGEDFCDIPFSGVLYVFSLDFFVCWGG